MGLLNIPFIIEYIMVILGILVLILVPRYAKIFWSIDNNIASRDSDRLISIDVIRGMAILGVVFIHSTYFLLPKFTNSIDFITLSLINNAFRFAIPVFLFTSGLLLKEFIYTYKFTFKFYTTKIIRILLPYVFITTILWKINGANTNLVKNLFSGDMAVPFYFIPVLFQLYLIYPLLSYVRKVNPILLFKISLIISIISFLLPVTWQFGGIPVFSQYLIFFVYGMLRQDILYKHISSHWRELIWLYFVIQLFIVGIVNIFQLNPYLYNSLYMYNFQIMFGFAFIFSLMKLLQDKSILNKILIILFKPLGVNSLWIFLLHFPIQQAIFWATSNLELTLWVEFTQNTILTLLITIPLASLIHISYKQLNKI